MILCQKPASLPLNPSFHHRRHPSAPPAVVVHPTCIPGLLSLSKPPRPSPQRPQQHAQQPHQQRQPRTPKLKPAVQRNRSPNSVSTVTPAAAKVPALKPSVDLTQKKTSLTQTATPAPSPDKNLRGRQQAKPAKDKTTRRSASHSSVSGQTRRNNNRQPSPPVQLSSQAEGPNFTHPAHSYSKSFSLRSSNHTSNHFDPFVANSSSDTDSGSDSTKPKGILTLTPLQPAPKLALRPSGKLAARRQPIPHPPASPSPPSRAVPVPRSIPRAHDNISRSDPVLSHMFPRHIDNKDYYSDIEWDSFPICDDMTIDSTPPSTPVLGRRASSAKDGLWQTGLTFDDGPRTAPLSTTTSFPFDGYHSPTPSPPTRPRLHQRTPSDGVFNLPFDDDTGLLDSDELKALFGMFPKRRSPSSVRLSKEKAGYFASSMFQNSPSPEELPPPSFGALA